MSSNTPLYGAPRPSAGLNRTKDPPISSTSAAFTSQLSSLLAQTSTSHASKTAARARPSKPSKEDIFRTHNKNTKKRALADISTDGNTRQSGEGGAAMDAADLHRSKRKMEEKARLYAAMKRGDYVPPTTGRGEAGRNLEETAMVDFDRKWADSQANDHTAGSENQDHDTSSGEDDDDDDGDDGDAREKTVTYTDEFGRLRTSTAKERDRHLARQNAASYASSQLESFSARPSAPTSLLHGDVIQTAAFNPDHTISAQMDELARKRDKELTPPPETHYDASKEIRAKGVGFYQFSRDEEGRKEEMESLESMREGTERVKREREERRGKREREMEERRRVVERKRGERLAERFLKGLG
ncbi:MAG: hypothetical protein Q9192_001780 [Flavoplaca navasiana]